MLTEEEGNVLPYGSNASDAFRAFNQFSKNFYNKNTNLYQRILMHLPFAVLIIKGPEFIIESANAASGAISDKICEATGKPLLEVIPDFSREYLQILNDVYETGRPYYNAALPLTLTKNGKAEKNYYTAECQPLIETDGAITGLVITGFDVTSHIATKQQLQKSDQQFKDMIVHAPVSIAIYRGRNFVFEFANAEYLQLVDRTKEELTGKPFFEALPEFKGQGLEELLHTVLDTGQPYNAKGHSISFTRRGKQNRNYSNFIYQPLRNASNEVDGIMVVLNDVSDNISTLKIIESGERQFYNLVMQSPVAMGILKGEDSIIDVTNKALLQLWQRTEDAVIGKKLMDVFPELKDQPYPALLKHVYETGEIYRQNEAVVYIGNGAGELVEKYVQFQYVPLLDVYKGISGIIVTANDITAQVKARKQIEENEQYFRKMADSVPAIIVLWKSDGYCTYKNRRWYEFTGAKEQDAQGFGWLNYIDINSRPEVQKKLFDAIKNQTSLKIEFQLKRADGEYRWFEKMVTPRYNEEGKIEGYIGTLTDIHERKLAEEKLRDAEERLRLAVEATGLATFDMDMQTFTTICSPRLLELLGLHSDEPETALQRAELLQNIYSEDVPVIENALQQAYENGHYSYEVRVILPDSSIRWITTKGKIYYGKNRKPIRMIGMVEDITRRKQLEQHKDSFISIVSHELKTPVTSLKVYNQMLHEKFEAANDTPSASMLQKMDNQINKLSLLIKDLLDTARIDTGRLQVEYKLFDFNTVVDQIVEEVSATGINHRIVKKNNQSYFIKGDALRTAQVLTNLLGNAVKYSPQSTNIIINTQQEDNRVLCSVQDFGMGISTGNLVSVFDKYFRINNSTLGTYPGLGLGLFISSEIIRQQGGDIWADSNEGDGSTFWFSLPLAETENMD